MAAPDDTSPVEDLAFDEEIRAAHRAYSEPLPAAIDRDVRTHLTKLLGTETPAQHTGPVLQASHPDAPLIPDYSLIEKIGDGAYGTVWRASDLQGIPCAVKVLPKNARHSPGEKELKGVRQLREKGIAHQNLIAIHHVGSTADCWYYIMDLVDDTLEQRLKARSPYGLPPEEATAVTRDLLCALAACHGNGIAHRDIKPANIGFKKGVLKLLDLGLVTSSRRPDRTLVGTPDYMPHKPSPNAELDDLYAVGMLLYVMLTGLAPDQFPRLPAEASLTSSLFHALNRIACKACDRDPDTRFQAAETFLTKIEATATAKKIPSDARTATGPQITEGEGCNGSTLKQQPKEKIMKDKILNAVEFLKANNLPVSERLQQEVANLENPNYKIAVVGKFQVGKSKLINEVFIRDQVLLKEGKGLPKTAVTTEVVYGPEKRLEVFEWVKETVTVECGSEKGEGTIRTGELKLTRTIDNPTDTDLAECTTAGTGERTALTQRIGRVRLSWPCASLKKFTIFDTPGVDDPDRVLLANTTYRTIPQADAAILMVNPRMLDQAELQFLQSGIFAAGLTRLLVLVSYNPEATPMSAKSLQGAVATIQAQLQSVGRGYIPVKAVCYDASVDGGILNTPDAIEQLIVEFADANASMGRIEKVAQCCASELRQAINGLNARILAADKSVEERQRMLKDAKDRKTELRDKYNQFGDEFLDALRTAQNKYRQSINAGLDKVAASYKEGFDSLPDMTSVQTRLAQAEAVLRPQIEDLFIAVGKTFRQEMNSAAERFQSRFRALPDNMTTIGDFRLDGGFLAKIPPLILTILDYVLADLYLPGGIFLGFLFRWILGKIPWLRNILPTNLAVKLVVHNVKHSLDQQLAELKTELVKRLAQNFVDVEAKLRDGFDGFMAEELEPVIKVLSEPLQPGIDKAGIAKVIEVAKQHELALAAAVA